MNTRSPGATLGPELARPQSSGFLQGVPLWNRPRARFSPQIALPISVRDLSTPHLDSGVPLGPAFDGFTIAFANQDIGGPPVSRTMRATAAMMVGALMVLASSACSSLNDQTVRSSIDATANAEALNDEALLSYAEAERAMIPKVLEQSPGLYSKVSIHGAFKEQNGDRGLPAGTYAVMFYDYTYAHEMNWSVTTNALDAQRPAIDGLCRSRLFPAMRSFGITGPMSVVYTYGDGRSEFGPMWAHTCSDY